MSRRSRQIEAIAADCDTTEVLLVRTMVKDALSDIYGSGSGVCRMNILKNFVDPPFDLDLEHKQAQFSASLPLVERALTVLLEDQRVY